MTHPRFASLLVAGGERQAARELLARAEVEDPDIYTERAVLELMRGDKDAPDTEQKCPKENKLLHLRR